MDALLVGAHVAPSGADATVIILLCCLSCYDRVRHEDGQVKLPVSPPSARRQTLLDLIVAVRHYFIWNTLAGLFFE